MSTAPGIGEPFGGAGFLRIVFRLARRKKTLLERKTAAPKGFTLLELVVVLLILGVFISIIPLRIESFFTGGDLQVAGRMIAGRVQELRGRAASSRIPQMLGLDIDRNEIYAVEDIGSGRQSSTGFIPAAQAEPRRYSLPDGARIEDVVVRGRGKTQMGEARIRFFANGTAERALIHLRGESDLGVTLAVNPLTGQVKIHDRYIEEKAR